MYGVPEFPGWGAAYGRPSVGGRTPGPRRRRLIEYGVPEFRYGRRRLIEYGVPEFRWLVAEIARLDDAIAARLAACPPQRQRSDLLVSVPGIGRLTAASLVALMPELGHIDGKAAASLAGVAPFARDSGVMRGRRTIWAAAPRCVARSTWRRWSPRATTP